MKVADLLERWKVQAVTVTISRLAIESTIPNPRDIDPATHKPREVKQPVLYFTTKAGSEYPRGYLLSAKCDIENLKSATGGLTISDVIGKKIQITVSEHRGKAVLRISQHPQP